MALKEVQNAIFKGIQVHQRPSMRGLFARGFKAILNFAFSFFGGIFL